MPHYGLEWLEWEKKLRDEEARSKKLLEAVKAHLYCGCEFEPARKKLWDAIASYEQSKQKEDLK